MDNIPQLTNHFCSILWILFTGFLFHLNYGSQNLTSYSSEGLTKKKDVRLPTMAQCYWLVFNLLLTFMINFPLRFSCINCDSQDFHKFALSKRGRIDIVLCNIRLECSQIQNCKDLSCRNPNKRTNTAVNSLLSKKQVKIRYRCLHCMKKKDSCPIAACMHSHE